MEENIKKELQNNIKKTLENLDHRFNAVRAGRANPSSLDDVMVEYYEVLTPLKQLAVISVPEGNQLLIKPFDKTSLKNIEKAIFESNLGYTPNNDGETIRIIIPALTEERRIELIRHCKAISEDSKISIRNLRRDSLTDLQKLELSEDLEKTYEKEIQDIIDDSNKQVDEKLKQKEEELLTI